MYFFPLSEIKLNYVVLVTQCILPFCISLSRTNTERISSGLQIQFNERLGPLLWRNGCCQTRSFFCLCVYLIMLPFGWDLQNCFLVDTPYLDYGVFLFSHPHISPFLCVCDSHVRTQA